MGAQSSFLRKEFREIFRTYKIYVIPGVFLLFGFLSPILAKLMPDLLKSMAQDLKITIPTPTAIDAYAQLFKNLNQMGILAVIFTLIGQVADEKIRGTAVLMLTKPVPKWSFIVSKFIASSSLVILSTLLSYLACLYYTLLLFKDARLELSALAVTLLIAYYLLVMAVTLLASTVSRSVALSGALSVGGFLILSILPTFHRIFAQYSPGALVDYQNRILAGTAPFSEAVPALGITIVLTALLVGLAVAVFKRQEL